MITHEECKTAQEHAQANLDQVKQIEANIIRHPQPIFSESGKVIGHRLVKVGTKESQKAPKAPTPEPKFEEINSKNDTDMKTCTKCGESLPLDAFGKNKKSKDGINPCCKACVNTAFREAYNAKRGKPTKDAANSLYHTVGGAVCKLPISTATISLGDVAQSCKHDEGKLRYDLCPAQWSEALAEVMTSGLVKYQPNSWRGGESCSFEAALMRHLVAWRKGETQDPESGLNHLKHVMANAAILLSITDK